LGAGNSRDMLTTNLEIPNGDITNAAVSTHFYSRTHDLVLIGERDLFDRVCAIETPAGARSVHYCADLSSAIDLLPTLGRAVAICDVTFGHHSWRDLVTYIRTSMRHIPVIVVLRHVDERLWLDVLDAGGDDVMLFPLDKSDFFHVIRSVTGVPPREKSFSAGHA
jgi:DNA-binding NarL/FixJ family response regulator